MDINNLSITKNAQLFLIKKKLTKSSIDKYFKTIKKEGNFIIKEIQTIFKSKSSNDIKYSLAIFKIHEEPSFLENTNLIDVKYCYCFLIEINNTLVVYKKNSESPEKSLSHYIEEYSYSKICHFKGDENPDYEKISMNNMSLTNSVIRTRSYEALRLNGIMSSMTTGRAIPRNFRMKINNEIYTLTPNTSRVALRDKKCSVNEIIDWSCYLISSINKEVKSDFIANFATPVTLEKIIRKKINVSAIVINLSELERNIFSDSKNIIKINKKPMKVSVMKVLFNVFKQCLEVDEGQWIRNKKHQKKINIKINLKSITIKSKFLDKIKIEEKNSNKILSLPNYINKNKLISAVFTDPIYSYWSLNCFEDKKLLNNLDQLLKYLSDDCDFTTVKSEKEKSDKKNYNKQSQRFPKDSLFYIIEEYFDKNDPIIICDDMGDEWADHIVIDNKSIPPSLKFIHEKFIAKDGLGASEFHEVISQALKNIGRLHESISSYEVKYNKKWKNTYEDTQIYRIKNKNSLEDIKNRLEEINRSTDATRTIVIATPFLKKSSLKNEFDNFKKNSNYKLKPYHIQLIWLLSSFIFTCQDNGIKPLILCKK